MTVREKTIRISNQQLVIVKITLSTHQLQTRVRRAALGKKINSSSRPIRVKDKVALSHTAHVT